MFKSALIKIGDRFLCPEEIVHLLNRYHLLPQLIKEVIIDEAIINLDCSPEEQKLACEEFYHQQMLTTPAQQADWLEKHQITSEQLAKQLARQVKVNKFKQITWGSQLKAHFTERQGQLHRLVYSLLRTNDLATAQDLYFRLITQEESFADLARENSLGPEAKNDGLVGPVELGSLHPTLAENLAQSEPGQLLPPLELGQWFIIVRLEEWLPVELDQALAKKLLDDLFNQWLNKKQQESFGLYEVSLKSKVTYSRH